VLYGNIVKSVHILQI